MKYNTQYPTLTLNINDAYKLADKRFGFYRIATAYKFNGMVLQLRISEEKDENMNYKLREPILTISPEHAGDINLYRDKNNNLKCNLNLNGKEIVARIEIDASAWREDDE